MPYTDAVRALVLYVHVCLNAVIEPKLPSAHTRPTPRPGWPKYFAIASLPREAVDGPYG